MNRWQGLKVRPFLWIVALCLSSHVGAKTPSQAAVASAHPLATAAGQQVLQAGGNAFDAAVAVSAALAVVEPAGSGMGGGGFWLLYLAEQQRYVMVDGREAAPLAAHRDMYVDEQGQVQRRWSLDGALAAAIPGQAAALAHLAKEYGRLPLSQSLAPAIAYAEQGVEVDARMHWLLNYRSKVLSRFPASRAVFMQGDRVLAEGEVFRQPDLANTLSVLGEQGHKGFYAGEVAQQLVAANQAAGGIWQLQDLSQYRVIERDPVRFSYRGWQVVSAAPPSSGGVALAQMLGMLEPYPVGQLASVDRMHLVTEVMRRAYRDRAAYLGDPDFVSVPVAELTAADYIQKFASSIRMGQATPSSALPPAVPSSQGTDTTHFSVLDPWGNRVAATLSINTPFGSGLIAEGTGVLLNNEMDDFSSAPGVPNDYGLVGAEANAIAPGKRPLSSMSPSMLENAQGVAILGTPGGSRIISMVLLGILELVDGQQQDPAAWVAAPRYHHQYLPDTLFYEQSGLTEAEISGLSQRQHTLKEIGRRYGNMQAIYWDKTQNQVRAASDPRGLGQAWVGAAN